MNILVVMIGFIFIDGVYYVFVCVLNEVGFCKCISFDGVLIDFFFLSYGVVYDGIMVFDRNYQFFLISIVVNWEGIWDLDSGIEKFEWSIGISNYDKISVLNYIDVGFLIYVRSYGNLNLICGKKYYVYLKVINQVGFVREFFFDGIVVDGILLIFSVIYLGFGFNSKWNYNDQE